MSPIREPTTIAGDQYRIRLVGPRASVWPDAPQQNTIVLGCTTMVARPLPSSNVPSSPDFVSGSWTGRLGDAGDGALTFPNKEASDGVPWRQRFDPTGHLQFVEIYRNNELDFCGMIDQIPTIDQQQVQIHSSDGWFLLKKAYERDWIVTQSPRDVIERGTQFWVPTVADNFPASSTISGSTLKTPFTTWTTATANGGTVGIGASGGIALAVTSTTNSNAQINSPTVSTSATGAWRASADIAYTSIGLLNAASVALIVTESGSHTYDLYLYAGRAVFQVDGTNLATSQIASAPSYDLTLESDGEFVWAFVNGQMIGCIRRTQTTATTLQLAIKLANPGASSAMATCSSCVLVYQAPFLQRGTDKGDWVLPGNASTFPSGGLHARYFNDNDLQNDPNALSKILAPTRTNAYLGSGGPEYMDQQDSQVNGQNPPAFTASSPGAGTAALNYWSCVWFGSVYLKLSQGNYTLTIVSPTSAIRAWVGQTQFGTQLINQWTASTGSTYTATISAATLAGTLPYGAGTVARDGWYPIKIAYAVLGGTASAAPQVKFTPPTSYTDPGGTALAGLGSVAIPATSLSPLGCVDQRYQGISHYDLVQQTGQAFGYQLAVEPKQLESGLFPGVLAPRLVEGHATDVILAPDNGPGQDGEGIINYSSGLDATDFASSLQGNGAGFQNGNTGQLQARVYDPGTMLNSLGDVQQWQDFSDASYISLLQALLNAQLALQLGPWQLLSADPNGRPRQSYTWPLTGALAKMNWRPGDGLRIQARDINIWDTIPRQMLTITRNILPYGVASTQAAFALRPRTPARILKQQIYKATRWSRNYQRQRVSLTGNLQASTIAAGTTDTANSGVALLPGDQIVNAYLRVSYNSAAQSFGLLLNGGTVTASLNGPWTNLPLHLNLMPVAANDAFGRIYVQLNNAGTSSSTFQYQLIVDVLR